jgi:hypothetical protein
LSSTPLFFSLFCHISFLKFFFSFFPLFLSFSIGAKFRIFLFPSSPLEQLRMVFCLSLLSLGANEGPFSFFPPSLISLALFYILVFAPPLANSRFTRTQTFSGPVTSLKSSYLSQVQLPFSSPFTPLKSNYPSQVQWPFFPLPLLFHHPSPAYFW